MSKHTILFLAANPLGTTELALGREARAIQEELERSGHRDKFEFVTRWAVQPLDLLRELRKLKPTVVHFSGHGGRDEPQARADAHGGSLAGGGPANGGGAGSQQLHGLYFQGPDGRRRFVATAALKEVFGAAGASVKLVVLSACHSNIQAEALLAHVECVVGIRSSRTDVSRSFAIGFYGGLGERQSVAAAYLQGCAAISVEGLHDGDRPQLKVRAGLDATKAVLADYNASICDLLTGDLANWGRRHVFGNITREQWDDEDVVPFLPLETMYVQPSGALVRNGREQPAEPLLELIERLTATGTVPTVVVVTADFGSGKSLSARELARRWAERRLTSTAGSLEVALPVYVRCADDFPSATVDLKLTLRRAWKRQADSIGRSVAVDDDSLAWPSSEQRVVCLLDGFDEVALGAQHVQTLFQQLRDETTENHRFVIFSRRGALPASRELGDKVVEVHVQPFNQEQIEQWLARWDHLHPANPPITSRDLEERGLAEIAQTPILLFMIAFTWREDPVWTRSSIAEIYERFFYQVASGKAQVDPDSHGPVAAASEKLLAALQKARILDAGAERQDAMLWLMGRVAWEAHMLEQRSPPEALKRRHIDNLLEEGEVPMPPDAIDVVRIGLILTLQADLHAENHTILFGHKSFREFLVGRYWAMTLRRIVRGRQSSDSGLAMALLGGRLLGCADKSFDYLMQFINSPGGIASRDASPLGWSDEERERLMHWSQEVFADEVQEFGERARPRRRVDTTLRNDQRAELREAALAIGSMTEGSTGMRANPTAFRSMLAWFWLTGSPATIIAPRAVLPKAFLVDANLRGANLGEADLGEADLRGAHLGGAELGKINLVSADLRWANLSGALLAGGDLRGADLGGASLFGAKLRDASLVYADLRDSDLRGTDLRGANLHGADLRGSDLSGADLRGSDLRGADLRNTDLSTTKIWQADTDDERARSIRCDNTTMWPDGFDLSAHGNSGNTDASRRSLSCGEPSMELGPSPFHNDSVTRLASLEFHSILTNEKNILGED